jgi:hypothetical protein
LPIVPDFKVKNRTILAVIFLQGLVVFLNMPVLSKLTGLNSDFNGIISVNKENPWSLFFILGKNRLKNALLLVLPLHKIASASPIILDITT